MGENTNKKGNNEKKEEIRGGEMGVEGKRGVG